MENKELLLEYLCNCLPYKIYVNISGFKTILRNIYWNDFQYVVNVSPFGTGHGSKGKPLFDTNGNCLVKPYIRKMSSMTLEEELEFITIGDTILKLGNKGHTCICSIEQIKYLNKHHLDYLGLIDLGLALEAEKDMYKL